MIENLQDSNFQYAHKIVDRDIVWKNVNYFQRCSLHTANAAYKEWIDGQRDREKTPHRLKQTSTDT